MQTLIAFFAEHIREGGRSGGGGYRRHDAKYLDRQGPVGGGGGKNGGSDYYLGKSDNFLNKERGRKTPFEIFLEDDGPYSRKLYGPVTTKSSALERSRERQSQSQKSFSPSKLVGGLSKLRKEKLVYTPVDNFREKVSIYSDGQIHNLPSFKS